MFGLCSVLSKKVNTFFFFSIYVIRVGERCRFCQVEEVCVCLEFNEGAGAGHPFIV